MKKKRKEKSIKDNRILIRVLYYSGLLLFYIFGMSGLGSVELEMPLYQLILWKILLGSYMLLGFYIIIVYNIPLFSKGGGLRNAENYQTGLFDLIGPIFLLIMIIVI